jgi:hypothetical protein
MKEPRSKLGHNWRAKARTISRPSIGLLALPRRKPATLPARTQRSQINALRNRGDILVSCLRKTSSLCERATKKTPFGQSLVSAGTALALTTHQDAALIATGQRSCVDLYVVGRAHDPLHRRANSGDNNYAQSQTRRTETRLRRMDNATAAAAMRRERQQRQRWQQGWWLQGPWWQQRWGFQGRRGFQRSLRLRLATCIP